MRKRNLPHRKSIRLKGWDYRNPGLYFITICTKNRRHHFGEIRDSIMGLSVPGCLAHYYWTEIPNEFDSVQLDEYIVMPDHMHGIIAITGREGDKNQGSDAMNRVPDGKANGGITGKHNPMLYKNHLARIMRWYKGRCTFEIRKRDYSSFAWQSRFYDHIIRNEKALHRIRKYIRENPLKWQIDRENIGSNEIHERAVEYMAES